MLTMELICAAALLAGPRTPDVEPAVALVLRPQVLALAMSAEVVDARELGYLMTVDILGDLAMLQGRYRDFAAVPALDEVERFPDRATVTKALEINRARLPMDLIHAEEIGAAIRDLDVRYQAWDAVRDARQDYYYVTTRRPALDCLRSLLGDAAFYSGNMVSPIP